MKSKFIGSSKKETADGSSAAAQRNGAQPWPARPESEPKVTSSELVTGSVSQVTTSLGRSTTSDETVQITSRVVKLFRCRKCGRDCTPAELNQFQWCAECIGALRERCRQAEQEKQNNLKTRFQAFVSGNKEGK
jgi:hypothetical protein